MANARLTDLAILMRDGDDVAVARQQIDPQTLDLGNGGSVTIVEKIPAAHKFALRTVPQDDAVRKYGQIIGFAKKEILAGTHVHTHNVGVRDFERDYRFTQEVKPVEMYPASKMRTFMGYARPNGQVATRNYVAVISTVNCSASVATYVARHFTEDRLKDYPNVDGVLPITHKGGCGLALGGEDYVQLQRTLAGFARHPNIFGYVIIGLGCEVNQVVDLVDNQR
ncbi:MAG: UxaA family hydrolase, partial [Candidatus Poribacteria bacterium]|nr:UxaA family hydrolase [Candidatus Poribacteria bacterium]